MSLPKVCEFDGIAISVHYREHPEPHFHVRYAGFRAKVGIHSPAVLAGDLPPNVTRRVLDWARLRQRELMVAWDQAMQCQPMSPVDP